MGDPLPTPTFPEHSPTVPGLLAYCAENFAGADCVVSPDERLDYAALERQSRHLAARLVEAGVTKGSHVGILLPNGPAWVVTWAAAARIGAVVVPVNTFYKAPELARFLRHSDIQCLIGVPSFIQHDYIERLESIAPELTAAARSPLRLPALPQLRRILLWGESPRAWAEGGVGAGLDAEIPEVPEVLSALVDGMGEDVTPGDPMLITYTSGSTGEPKGVVHTHGGVIRHARNLAALSSVDAGSRLWTPMPLCWVGGFAFTLLRAMTVGACFLTQEVYDPGVALRLIEREKVTVVSAWPAIAKSLTEHPDYAHTDVSSVRGGSFYDGLPPDRRPPDPGLAVTSLGMSETCGPHTFWRPGEEVTGSPEEYRGTFGHEVPGTEHRIVDSTRDVDLPEGEEGEVLVRGYSVMQGLYKKERSEVFDRNGWYHTGDRGFFRDGWFFFTGRQSDLIKTSGSNVAPAEVEGCLLRFAGVKLAFVVGVPHPDRGQDVIALVVPWQRNADVSPAGLREQLREELSSYKVPRQIFVIRDEDVPWLVSQKVDRRALVTLAEKLVGAADPGLPG